MGSLGSQGQRLIPSDMEGAVLFVQGCSRGVGGVFPAKNAWIGVMEGGSPGCNFDDGVHHESS